MENPRGRAWEGGLLPREPAALFQDGPGLDRARGGCRRRKERFLLTQNAGSQLRRPLQ